MVWAVGMAPLPRALSAPDDVRRFQQCYALFTSTRVPSGDARLAAVKAGSKAAVDACMEVFDLATLGPNNRLIAGSDPTALAVFRKFHEWGRGYVMNKDFFSSFEADHTAELHDPYAFANAMTYLLFQPNQSFAKLLTDTTSYRAIRDRSQTTNYLLTNPYVTKDFRVQVGDASPVAYTPSVGVQQGRLVGVEPLTPSNLLNVLPARFPNKNLSAHLGGGVLGIQGYLLPMFSSGMFNRIGETTESTYRKDSAVNGVSVTPRRLGKVILADLLCRDLPALHESDVVSLASASYSVPFRKAVGCTSCHASIDPFAAVYRNQVPIQSLAASGISGFRFFSTRTPDLSGATTLDAIFPPNGDDPDFYRRPPNGQLRFRSYDGSLVSYDVNGLADLGSKMSLTKDLYVCAASKFYRYLTGIKVDLADLTRPNAGVLTSGALYHRNQVIQLGADPQNGLIQHKSLRTLIRRIIESNAFLYPGVPQ